MLKMKFSAALAATLSLSCASDPASNSDMNDAILTAYENVRWSLLCLCEKDTPSEDWAGLHSMVDDAVQIARTLSLGSAIHKKDLEMADLLTRVEFECDKPQEVYFNEVVANIELMNEHLDEAIKRTQ